MDSIKVAEDAAAGTIIKTITPVLANGGAAAAVFEFVDGKFGIDNAKFDIFGGILTNNNILASGTYWIRYKVTVGFNSVEKGLKIYTDDKEVAITVSDNEYTSDIAIGGTVATVSLSSGSLTDVEITPQSSADDAGAPAFSYDGATGNIEWTGDQTPVDYSYAIQYTGDCIKPIVVEDFEAIEAAPALPASPCAAPGTGYINNDRVITTRGQVSGHNDFTGSKALLDDINHTDVFYPPTNGRAFFVSASGPNTVLDRTAIRFDFSSGVANLNMVIQHTTGLPVSEKVLVVYKTGDIETGRTNPLYDMPSWSNIGTISAAGDFDIANIPPATTNVWIGILWQRDDSGSFGGYDVSDSITADIQISQTYKCP